MRTAESRDLMVARVQSAFADHPTFDTWLEVKASPGALLATLEPPQDNASYVAALHEICAKGEVIGRTNDALVGRRINEDDQAPAGRVLKAERPARS